MKLHELRPNEGKQKRRRRVGRGIAAGRGKTAGRGTKGQGARAGGGSGLYHQGGNLPFFRSLPFKRGFTPPNRLTYNEINLDQLEGFKANSEVSPDTLEKARLLRKNNNPIVVLGRGEITKALKVRVHRVTKGAKAKIEAAGGSVEIIQSDVETPAEEKKE
ncbi:MAG: 50S ribosomal protein L15 [Chloroflexi bacterium]|nr:50S ribosomal protein L15 [Chloroflexota bacterium]MQC26488.1 50S ribosomal protein L15 [Chloroflexota bacterium]